MSSEERVWCLSFLFVAAARLPSLAPCSCPSLPPLPLPSPPLPSFPLLFLPFSSSLCLVLLPSATSPTPLPWPRPLDLVTAPAPAPAPVSAPAPVAVAALCLYPPSTQSFLLHPPESCFLAQGRRNRVAGGGRAVFASKSVSRRESFGCFSSKLDAMDRGMTGF